MQELESWGQRHRIVAVYLHGSAARGTMRPDSDVDLAVLLSSRSGWREEDALVEELRALLQPRFEGRELDVKILNEAPPAFQFQVIKARHLLFERDPSARVSFERRLLNEYLDYRYYEDLLQEAMVARIKEGSFGRRPPISAPAPRRD